ncbi:outer membrane efflux protein [Fulvivirga imtechensis AK7]|uniref:Outer membrane efflux protein n=1 Tax=Fulvivirga imtechensis AK7 TaxID=1237149 RepID=L8JRT8_9BACT|nr:TolC family protein [Fulvivirga imtechensis]ELR70082.1 outer membrane efflux protein [Fulvivirga imtechensis AK7]
MINRISLTTTLIVLLCSAAFGQEGTTIDSPLTFKEAVKLALENNISLKQQQNQLSSASMSKTSNLLQMGPSLSITGNTGRNDGNSFNQQEGRVVNGLLDFTNATFRASMPLFQGFNQLNSYKASKYRFEAQIETVERTKEDIIQLVTTRYLQCLLDTELVKIAERNMETQQTQLQQINLHVEAGSRAAVDATNQEYQLKNAELNLLRAKNALRNDKAQLAQTLQLDPLINFNIEEPAWNVNEVNANVSSDELYAIAVENRSDLAGAKHNESSMEFNYRAMKGNYYPSISAFFNYGSAYNYIHGGTNRNFEQQFLEDNVQKTYGISFTIPIFNGLLTRSNVVQSKVTYENAALDVENLELQVKSQVLLAYQNLQDAVTTYQVAQTQLEAAELSFELGRERYELGISNLVEYTQANQDLVQAQTDFARAKYTLMFQELLLDYSTGTLSFEDLK